MTGIHDDKTAYTALYSSNQEIVYPVPGTDVTLLMIPSGPPPRGALPARPISPSIIQICLQDASFYAGILAGRHGGWHHTIAEDFIRVRAGVRFNVFGNHEVAHVDWPRYADIITVITGLQNKLPQLHNLETEIIMFRNGRRGAFGFADFVYNDRRLAAANGTEEKRNLTTVTLSSSSEGLTTSL